MNVKDAMQRIARDHFVVRVSDVLGDNGTDALRDFIPRVREIYRGIDYDSISGSLTVFRLEDQSVGALQGGGIYLSDAAQLALHNEGVLSVQLQPDGSLYAWKDEIDALGLSGDAIVYRYSSLTGEKFYVNGLEARVPESPGYPLLFAVPSFSDLYEALLHYSSHVGRPSECPILIEIWRDKGRVMWKPAPETDMRRSLYYFLRWTLRDGNPDVTQETNVDEKNPVDIQVRWAGSNRIAIIEIKWLGKSGRLNPPAVTKKHADQRAKDGLAQLADYLDRSRGRAPFYDRRGFLMIFDGRRRAVRPETEEVTRENGFYYQDRDIDFPSEHLNRSDMAPPIRCFCEPLLSAGRSPSAAPAS